LVANLEVRDPHHWSNLIAVKEVIPPAPGK